MATRVTGVRIDAAKKKIVRVHKVSVSKKIGMKAKAERQARAWGAKSKRGD